MRSLRGLTIEEVEKFYDRFGAEQDKQNYYEDIALADLLKHARFDVAHTVVEFGCGTGRFANQLLGMYLPDDATYWGCDVSATMIELSGQRLSGFGNRATLCINRSMSHSKTGVSRTLRPEHAAQ
jgi:ubiquinone/menaquinone biosynthesis C-methylase UbiE